VRFDADESRELLISFLFILKHINREIIHQWWRAKGVPRMLMSSWLNLSIFSSTSAAFLELLQLCLSVFEYVGKDRIVERIHSSASATSHKLKSSTLTVLLSFHHRSQTP
jgi:hypothetical protein